MTTYPGKTGLEKYFNMRRNVLTYCQFIHEDDPEYRECQAAKKFVETQLKIYQDWAQKESEFINDVNRNGNGDLQAYEIIRKIEKRKIYSEF